MQASKRRCPASGATIAKILIPGMESMYSPGDRLPFSRENAKRNPWDPTGVIAVTRPEATGEPLAVSSFASWFIALITTDGKLTNETRSL